MARINKNMTKKELVKSISNRFVFVKPSLKDKRRLMRRTKKELLRLKKSQKPLFS